MARVTCGVCGRRVPPDGDDQHEVEGDVVVCRVPGVWQAVFCVLLAVAVVAVIEAWRRGWL